MNATVFYDLDHTLIDCDSDYEWGRFMVDSKEVDAETYAIENQKFYDDYMNNSLDPRAYLRFVLEPLRKIDSDRLQSLREQFFEERIRPTIRSRAEQLIAEHRAQGMRQIVITSTNAFIAEPIVEVLGIPTLIAPHPEIQDGWYTGELLDGPCFAQDKPKRIIAWAEQEGIDLGETWGYSDSFNDRPLLEFVDHAIAVDPDPKLHEHALSQGWEIIRLTD